MRQEMFRRKSGGFEAVSNLVEELAEEERVRDLVQRGLGSAVQDFAAYERPKRFELLPRELTPTMKVKTGRAGALRRSRREAVFLE